MTKKKLGTDQKREIVRRLALGESQRSLAKCYGIDHSRISRLLQKYNSQLHGGSGMESVTTTSFYEQSQQGQFQGNAIPVKLSTEQEIEAAGRHFAFSEPVQDLASHYGVDVSEINRIKKKCKHLLFASDAQADLPSHSP